MILSVGLIAGIVIAGPVGFALGRFERTDRRVVRELDVSSLLRRSVR